MRILPFQAVYPNFDYIASPESFFGAVKYEYPEYKKSGFFNKTAQEAMYIYRIEGQTRNYTGLVACSDIRDYLEGSIKKHENTLASKEQQQMHLMISRDAAVKPVLLTYEDVPEISDLLRQYVKNNAPFYEVQFTLEAQKHIFWEVSDGNILQSLRNLFKTKVTQTFIADGHHRCSTTALMHERMKEKKDKRDYHMLLSAFFSADQLDIHDYNRVVEGLNDYSLTHFMARLSRLFDIEILDTAAKPKQKHELTMFVNREWFGLRWRPEILKTYQNQEIVLDTTMLDELVLRDILHIADIRTDQRIKYVEGPKGLEALRSRVIKNENRIAFCLYPVCLKDLMHIADQDKTLPPKSTWFEPRIKNGLIVQEFGG
ncbi:MAG: DUF1015 family protein [Bacteroidota bacterium]